MWPRTLRKGSRSFASPSALAQRAHQPKHAVLVMVNMTERKPFTIAYVVDYITDWCMQIFTLLSPSWHCVHCFFLLPFGISIQWSYANHNLIYFWLSNKIIVWLCHNINGNFSSNQQVLWLWYNWRDLHENFPQKINLTELLFTTNQYSTVARQSENCCNC